MIATMKRRELITLLGGAAAWPLAVLAQQGGKVPRIGYLSPGSASPGPLAYHDEFQRVRELGYVEGRNIVIEYRFADGKFDRLAALAAGLVQLNVDVIVSVVTQASWRRRRCRREAPDFRSAGFEHRALAQPDVVQLSGADDVTLSARCCSKLGSSSRISALPD